MGDAVARGRLGHSSHKMMEFLVRRDIRRGDRRTGAWDFWRAELGLFRRLVERLPWAAVLKGKGVQEGWTCFKKEILNAHKHRSCPHMLKDKQPGKTSLAEHRALDGVQGKKKSL